MESKVEVKKKTTGTLKSLRKIRENISKDIWGLSYEEFVRYLERLRGKTVDVL